MLSVNMRSAVCDCKIPDPCIHKLVLKVGKRVFNYNQIEPIGDIWVVDETGGIPVTISLVGKRCITENAQCPRAIFYSPDNAAFQFYELGKNPMAGSGTDYKISFSRDNLLYLRAQLDMVLEGALNLAFKYASNEAHEMEFELGDLVKGTLAIKAETNIQAGFKYYLVEGYFKADADIEAQGCFELDKQDKGLYLVFFHEGITASYYVEFGVGKGRSKTKSSKFNQNSSNKKQEKWEIYPRLPKEKSTYKLRLSR
ncbi:hypothetical protein [Photorhabdus asymbiotica]